MCAYPIPASPFIYLVKRNSEWMALRSGETLVGLKRSLAWRQATQPFSPTIVLTSRNLIPFDESNRKLGDELNKYVKRRNYI